MLNKIAAVKSAGGHVLRITFSDGAEGAHDFIAMVSEPGVMVEPLRSADFFARVFLEHGALTWPNGFDICPDWLRIEMEKTGALKRPVAAE